MNKNQFLKLLRKEEALQSENRSLSKINKSEYSELIGYRIVLQKQHFYHNRSQYIDLVGKCIHGEINCYAFQWDFSEIFLNDLETFDKLMKKISRYGINGEMNFHHDPKIENFFSLVDDNLVPMCEFLD
nr:hypothetical protein orf128 [Navicula sp.]WPV72674.1 hypothetical protein orf128 [Navicula sp.]